MINVLNERQIKFHGQLIANVSSMIGVTEVSGPKDHPFVVMCHQLTRVVGMDPVRSVDEIPWCASGMNAFILITNLQLNPREAMFAMIRWGVPKEIILQLRDYADVDDEMIKVDTGFPIVKPTFSAGASSYQRWGVEVARAAWIPGLVAGMTRPGGNHVSLFQSLKNAILILVGCNQHNMICAADWYLMARFKTMRAADI